MAKTVFTLTIKLDPTKESSEERLDRVRKNDYANFHQVARNKKKYNRKGRKSWAQ